MADERNEASRPSWRRKASEPARTPVRARHEWSERKLKPVAAARPPGPGVWKPIAAGLGLLACLAAVVALIILLWPPPSVAVVLAGADYADNLLVPQNALGWKGLEALEALIKAPPPRSFLKAPRLELIGALRKLDQPDDWAKLIKELASSGFRQQTIVIALALHGGSDAQGAYLYPDRMAWPQERIDLREVIRSLGELPPGKEKILVLEAAQVPSSWPLGMIHNDFARRLRELEDEVAKVPNLWVLSAADLDQRCWASEGLGRTVFAHYLIEGLRGRAAGTDGRLNLQDLHRYLARNVRSWVWNARGEVQDPVLLPRTEPRDGDGGAEKVASETADPKGGPSPRRSPGEILLPTLAQGAAPKADGAPVQDLRAAWEEHARLDSQIPHPAAYSPRRWRQYGAELVRLDELVRAGASDQAIAPIRGMVSASREQLEKERFLRVILSSMENNLAMSALEGPAGQRDDSSRFIPFWNAGRVTEAAKIWQGLAAEPGGGRGRASTRLRADDFLLTQASQDPGPAFDSAAEKLEITRGHDYPQPAEAHLARMLSRRLGPIGKQPAKLLAALGQAIVLRKQAERTALGYASGENQYSYCEQVYPWISGAVRQADSLRRSGEDQLFASDEAAWARASEAMGKARLLYGQVGERAATVRAAIEARNRALASLPELSGWVADRRQDENQGELIALVEKLWEQAHLLTEQLEKPPADPADGSALRRLRERGAEVSEGMSQLTGRFAELVERIDESRLKEDWQEASAAAGVPGGVANGRSLREMIWERLENIKKHDRETAALESSDTQQLTDEERARVGKRLRARVEAQGQMALAVLGESWFDDPASFEGQERGDRASTLGLLLAASRPDAEHTWSGGVATVGDRLGERWQRMAREIGHLADEQEGIRDFADFRDRRLAKADRLERLIHAGVARPADQAPQASLRLREARVHDLLLGMAERTWEDHWFDEDPKERYYLTVGSLFIDDADKFFPQGAPVKKARDAIGRKGRISAEVRPQVTFTSEAGSRFRYRLADEGTVPQGVPVVRAIVEKPLELDPGAGGFRVVARGQPDEAPAIAVRNPLAERFENDPAENRPRVVPSSIRLEGFFRGQEFSGTTAATIHPVPDTVAIGPAPRVPEDAHVAIRASKEIIARFGAGTGSIAIVLDCSGSMLNPTQAGRTKFDEAQVALGEVLRSVPPKTKLSVWTFSQLPPGVNQIFEGHPWGGEPELSISPLLPMAPWDPRQTDGIVGSIKQLKPYLGTPLVQAMWTAASRDLQNATGLKTLLVLTDGDDTELEKFKPKYNPNRLSVRDFIVNGFRPMGITVNMVFFTPAGRKEEIDTARSRFGAALAQLEPRGSFTTAKDLKELVATLQRGLIQKLTCQILRADGSPADDQPLEVTAPNEQERWCRGLKPGAYKIRVHAGTTLEQDIDLRAGDRMIIDLVEDQNGAVVFRRGLYGDCNEFAGQIREGEPWRTTLLANQVRDEVGLSRLQIATALESKPEGGPVNEIHQVGPGFAWFQLGADLVEHPERQFMTRWRERVFYPGPVWQFDVPRWIPGPAGERIATPILRSWWSGPESKPEQAAELRFDAPGRPGDLPRELRLGERNVVTIESIGLEEHLVEVLPGLSQPKRCLVIRLDFSSGHQCIVDPASLRGLQDVRHEHRIYTQAGKYTGLFWPVPPAEFQRMAGLALVDLEQFKEQAGKKRDTMRINLGQPTVESQVPSPPVVSSRPE
ncbi:MAG: hypothetical protein U0790_15635 [Isosphaeraceae bacterium]